MSNAGTPPKPARKYVEPVADVVDPSSVKTGRLAPATFTKPVEGLINWPPLVTFVFAPKANPKSLPSRVVTAALLMLSVPSVVENAYRFELKSCRVSVPLPLFARP